MRPSFETREDEAIRTISDLSGCTEFFVRNIFASASLSEKWTIHEWAHAAKSEIPECQRAIDLAYVYLLGVFHELESGAEVVAEHLEDQRGGSWPRSPP